MAIGNRALALIGLTLALLVPIYAQAASGQDAETALTLRAVAFVRTMATGSFDTAEANFTDQMKQAAPPDKLRQIWQSVLDQAGPFQGTGDSKTVDRGGYTTVIVRANFKTRVLGIAVTFDSAHRIAGMHFVGPP